MTPSATVRRPWRKLDLAGPPPPSYRWTALANTTIGAFMSALDGSIVTISLPTIARELHTGVGLMLWILLGYTVAITALVVPFGRLADLHGRVRLYFFGFVLFTLASAGSGLAQTGGMLLVSRLVQGVGAALLWSNSTAIVTDAFPASERGMALGINQVAVITGSLGGLVLGGIITGSLGWRYIFFINLPVGAFGALWTYLRLREVNVSAVRESFDTLGSVLSTACLVLLLLGVTRIISGDRGPDVALLLAAGIALMIWFVVVERRSLSPMVDLALLRIRAFTFGNLAVFLNALARGALMFLLTFAFQGLLGMGPLQAGIMIMPLSVTILVTGLLAGVASDRFGPRWLASIGLLISAVSLYALATIPLTGPYPPLAAALVVAGLGNGMFNSPNTSAVMGAVPPDRRGVAASMRSVVFNVGQLFSLAISFLIVSTSMGAAHLAAFLAGVGTVNHGGVSAVAFSEGLRLTFLISAGLSVVAAVLSFLRGSSRQPSPRRAPVAAWRGHSG
jgi:EmrB/QacA subfamily drug resistance transporter